MKIGSVYLVGAGPGDPGLITVRGRELLSRAEVVVYDYLASPRLLDLAPATAERIYVGKKAAAHTMGQADINQLLVDLGRAGKRVVRLKGGDPYVFGRGGEEALALVEAGVPFEEVPGITAGIAAAAYAGIPVTHRELASCMALITGHETPDKEETALDYKTLAGLDGTLAFYMGVANLGHICAKLIEHGLAADTPAAVIRWGTTSQQQVLAGTVTTLPETVTRTGFKPPALIVIGRVVALREQLNWFEKRPLFGRRIVVTRARAQASDFAAMLEGLGAEVIELPAIKIEPPLDREPLQEAARRAGSFDWIIFTSVNGVEAFFETLAALGRDARALAGAKVAAIGPATAQRLGQYGIRPDAQPARFIGTEVVETLAAIENLAGKSVLCPRADIAPRELIDSLAQKGAEVTEIAAYRTVADASNAFRVKEMIQRGEVHWLTFTSSSTVDNLVAAIAADVINAASLRIASIGPSTSATLRKHGLTPTVEAKEYTIQGLADAIVQAG